MCWKCVMCSEANCCHQSVSSELWALLCILQQYHISNQMMIHNISLIKDYCQICWLWKQGFNFHNYGPVQAHNRHIKLQLGTDLRCTDRAFTMSSFSIDRGFVIHIVWISIWQFIWQMNVHLTVHPCRKLPNNASSSHKNLGSRCITKINDGYSLLYVTRTL